MKLCDLIIKEFPGDEWMAKVAQCLNGNPVENGIPESEFREAFNKSFGYDPTTVYDFARIDKYYDDQSYRFRITENADKVKSDIKNGYVYNKDETVDYFVEEYLKSHFCLVDEAELFDDFDDEDDISEDEDDEYDDIVDDDDE